MTLLNGQLYVLRIEVATVENDQVLYTPCDEQFLVGEEPEVPSAKKTSFVAGQELPMKGGIRFLRPVPISLRHAWAAHPNLSNSSLFALR